MKNTRQDLEAIETRIRILRSDSIYCTQRIETYLENRKRINIELQKLRETAEDIKKQLTLTL